MILLSSFFKKKQAKAKLHFIDATLRYYDARFIPIGFDAKTFLLFPKLQEEAFNQKGISLQVIVLFVWLCKDVEFEMIKKGELEENHYFHRRIMKIIELNPKSKEDAYRFLVSASLEDKSIHPHWNIIGKMSKEDVDKLIYKSLYADSRGFSVFLSKLGSQRLEEVRCISKDKPDSAMNLKTKAMKDTLTSGGAFRTQQKKLFDLINANLNLPNDFDILLKNIDLDKLDYYSLFKLNFPELEQKTIEHSFNNVLRTTTVRNVARHNMMIKSLENVLYKREAYDFEGNVYQPNQFDELMNYFRRDAFLKTTMVGVFKDKAMKAKKKENQVRWNYYATLIESDQRLESNPKIDPIPKRILKV